jgi:hypothetical protein
VRAARSADDGLVRSAVRISAVVGCSGMARQDRRASGSAAGNRFVGVCTSAIGFADWAMSVEGQGRDDVPHAAWSFGDDRCQT